VASIRDRARLRAFRGWHDDDGTRRETRRQEGVEEGRESREACEAQKAEGRKNEKGQTGETLIAEKGEGARQGGHAAVRRHPQIAMGYGEAPVQAYIDAMPGWKSETWRRLDALITRNVPNVYKSVKWNSPFYGLEGEGWFLSVHCFDKYIKVAFFKGVALDPVPPGKSRQADVRYLDVREGALDEKQFADWVKQARKLPGEKM